ncbi:type II toxin-antitoxin system Phd/YefM family antitoxin [Nocardia sp. NPDC058480]|uniref:type II toxin-antitoxin system Phd/YefM family antitoxin n=1 Tax=unclassified Nocardia TaxID=2637762 RepID=UPI003656C1F9
MTDTVSASEARNKLFPLIEEVNNDRTAIHITSKKGNAVLLSEEEYNSMRETLYLLRSPANAARLAQGIAQAESGDVVEFQPEGDQ